MKTLLKKILEKWPGLKNLLLKISEKCPLSLEQYLESELRPVVMEDSRQHSGGGSWENYFIDAILHELRQAPAAFLRMPTISRALHPNQQGLASDYLLDLRRDSFSRLNILPRLHDIPMGNPYLCHGFPLASPVSVQHAYYFMLMNKYLHIIMHENDITRIVDFGGGYGNFCRLAYTFGYSGHYTIIDFPEIHALQRHYLSYGIGRHLIDKLQFITTEELHKISNNNNSLFIATFSLSETQLEIRRRIYPILSGCDYFFIAYNNKFDGIDNLEYFSNLASSLKQHFAITQFADAHRQARFFMGRRKEQLCYKEF